MVLAAGARLGLYQIVAPIGAGGMGEVYHARDTKLNRDVALKILPDAFAGHPDRLARFTREAQTLAALNHPHIAHIYGLEESDGVRALVMELVQGEDLSERIARGPIPLDETLPIARQIAEALEAAHGQGIIHRDLKPANIKVRGDGAVKVLDFGLAKALDPPSSSSAGARLADSPTITSPAAMTAAGIILGTAAYMSPEQARGKVVDKRTDIWAFGCVLYEMLTGRRPFDGDDVSDTIAAILRADPDWSRLRAGTPIAIRRLLRRCLEKDRMRRLADIGDARLDLEEAVAFPEPVAASVGTRRATSTTRRWAALAIVGALIAGGFIGSSLTRGTRENRATIRFATDVTPADRLAGVGAGLPAIALSTDGRTLVFSGTRGTTRQLFSRSFDQSTATPLAGTEGALAPFFSPDGRWIAFMTDTKLKKVSAAGGLAIDICNVGTNFGKGASWGSNETIAFSTGRRIFTVSASGGTPREIVRADEGNREDVALSMPQWLPRETALLYTARSSADWTQARIVVQPTDGGAPRTLVVGAADARYVATGHLLYMKRATLVAAPFDPLRLEITGAPVALLDDVMQAVNAPNLNSETGAGQVVVASAGTLAYVTGGIFPDRVTQLVWVDRRGVETPLKHPPGPIYFPRLSPDGKRFAYTLQKSGSLEPDIWVYDLARDVATRLTFAGDTTWPAWAPDGRHILFSGVTRGADLYWISPDGGEPAERVLAVPSPGRVFPSSASSTGLLALVNVGAEGRQEVSVLPLNGERKPTVVLQGPFGVAWPVFSSDGRWLAYVSNESGRDEVYVQAYPGHGDKHRISRDGGTSPVWARNGRELFYQVVTPGAETKMMAVHVDTTNGFRSGEPLVLFSGQQWLTGPVRSYDVSADGQRFIMTKPQPSPARPVTSVHIVFNWLEELKTRVPAR